MNRMFICWGWYICHFECRKCQYHSAFWGWARLLGSFVIITARWQRPFPDGRKDAGTLFSPWWSRFCGNEPGNTTRPPWRKPWCGNCNHKGLPRYRHSWNNHFGVFSWNDCWPCIVQNGVHFPNVMLALFLFLQLDGTSELSEQDRACVHNLAFAWDLPRVTENNRRWLYEKMLVHSVSPTLQLLY